MYDEGGLEQLLQTWGALVVGRLLFPVISGAGLGWQGRAGLWHGWAIHIPFGSEIAIFVVGYLST
jgi:hypothetical protein